jgi:hypothetical protein
VEVNSKSRQRLWIKIIAGIVGLVVLLVGGYLVWQSFQPDEIQPKVVGKMPELPRMANLPPKKAAIPPPPPPSYTPDAPVLEKVRQALRDGITPEEAMAMVKDLPESPEKADAVFLLLEYAADSGLAEAALAVARYYDPTDKEPSGTIRKNAETSYGWYQDAMAGGQDDAKARLTQLRSWVEEQAKAGSLEARELLNTW